MSDKHAVGSEIEIERRLVENLISGKPHPESFKVAVGTILIMTSVTFLYWRNKWGLSHLLPANGPEIFVNGQWWRPFTAIFVHANMEHLISNMYMLGIFTYFVFGYFGFLTFPCLTLIGAALVNLLAVWTYGPEVQLLGASGLVYLLGGFWLTMYFFIQHQYRWSNRLLRVTGVALVIFGPTTFVPTTSYRTHAIGFFVGVLTGVLYFYINKSRIRKFEVYKIQTIPAVAAENRIN